MSITDIANGLVELCKEGKFEEAINAYYAESIVSVEPMGDPATVAGIDAVRAKMDYFHETMEVHGLEVFGPYVNGNQFAVRFLLDATNKAAGKRMTMDEIAIYTIEGEKIVHEVFLF